MHLIKNGPISNNLSLHVHFSKSRGSRDIVMLVEEDEMKVHAGLRSYGDKGAWGYYSCQEVYGVGFMYRIADITVLYRQATFYSRPIQPVLAMHVMVSNESALFTQGAEPRMLQEDSCLLFVQGDKKIGITMQPGKHTQIHLYLRPSWIEDHIQALQHLAPHLEAVQAGIAYPSVGATSIKAGTSFEEALNLLVKEGRENLPLTSELNKNVINLLRYML